MPDFQTHDTRLAIARVVQKRSVISPKIAEDIAFHMTDWLSDLEAFADFCERPNEFSDEKISRILINFLVHAPNHIAAAAKLYTDEPVEDIFGVGAVACPSEEGV
jgi:hypothetical protein